MSDETSVGIAVLEGRFLALEAGLRSDMRALSDKIDAMLDDRKELRQRIETLEKDLSKAKTAGMLLVMAVGAGGGSVAGVVMKVLGG